MNKGNEENPNDPGPYPEAAPIKIESPKERILLTMQFKILGNEVRRSYAFNCPKMLAGTVLLQAKTYIEELIEGLLEEDEEHQLGEDNDKNTS